MLIELIDTLIFFFFLLQGFHSKPVGILNIAGFFNHLLAFMDHATSEGFIRQSSRDIIISGNEPSELIDKLLNYEGKKKTCTKFYN